MIKRVPQGDSSGLKFAKQKSVGKRNPRGREIVTGLEYRRRTIQMAERQDWKCGLCGKYMTMGNVTFEHTDLRSGGRRNDTIEPYENARRKIVQNCAAHRECNGAKGSKRL